MKIGEIVIYLYKKAKETRKKLIWFDKTNLQLILLNRYKIYLNKKDKTFSVQ